MPVNSDSLSQIAKFASRVAALLNTLLSAPRTFAWRLLPVFALAGMGANCPGPNAVPPPKSGSWLVFLCKASDNASEPHTPAFYKELFASNQRELLFDYFQDVSDAKVDVSGTDVFGWFTLPSTTAAIAPSIRNNSTNPNRLQTLQDCKSAGTAALLASNQQIDPSKYFGVIAVVNVAVDAGQAGQGVVANAEESVSFFEHEMLHVHGLPHSFLMTRDTTTDHSWELGADIPYNDCWDIMSFDICTYQFASASHGVNGPSLNIAYREKLGWVPANRIFTKNGQDVAPSTITLAPVTETTQAGPLMAKLVLPGTGTYAIEYRTFSGFDQAVQRPLVVIRELRGGNTYLVNPSSGRLGYGLAETFTDFGNYVSIKVDALTAHSATITINTRVASPAMLGDRCGDKYLGTVRQCPAGSTCNPRHGPVLVTDDYFCL